MMKKQLVSLMIILHGNDLAEHFLKNNDNDITKQ